MSFVEPGTSHPPTPRHCCGARVCPWPSGSASSPIRRHSAPGSSRADARCTSSSFGETAHSLLLTSKDCRTTNRCLSVSRQAHVGGVGVSCIRCKRPPQLGTRVKRWYREAERNPMATRSHCSACGLTFHSVTAFDAHRTGSYG